MHNGSQNDGRDDDLALGIGRNLIALAQRLGLAPLVDIVEPALRPVMRLGRSLSPLVSPFAEALGLVRTPPSQSPGRPDSSASKQRGEPT